jgi:two-component system chemotaxis response regulator CheB
MLNLGASMYASESAPNQPALSERPIRVMVVDDSAVVRGLVSRWIGEDPGLEVVARHPNGKLAVDDVAKSAPDIVLLDIDMPVMDGLTTLPLLLRARPGLRVLMVSTLTKRNAEISFKALSLGAIDYVPKPDSNRDITIEPEFRREVIEKIKVLGRSGWRSAPAAWRRDQAVGTPQHERRPFSLVPPRVIAIGSSTGGPQALGTLLGSLAPALSRVAVLVAQHMPPMFTTVLAERLARATGREAREGKDGEKLKPGAIFIAPGDHHMTIGARDGPTLRVSSGPPPVNFCRPAIDPMFASVASIFGPAALGIVLTGMGSDGVAGAGAIVNAGGSIIAQDEASSVVWGMPGAAVSAGLCAAVLPPAEIALTVSKLIRGERP